MNPIALEAQVVRELDPTAVIQAAAVAGYDHAGVWIDVARWTAQTTRDVRSAFAQTGVRPLDAEVLLIRGEVTDDQRRLLDIAGEIGVPHVLAVSFLPDPAHSAAVLAALKEHASHAGTALILEFGRFTTIATPTDALAIVTEAGAGIGILADPIHLARAGCTPADLALLPAEVLPFAQLCDAGPPPADLSAAGLLEEARFHRRELGEGVLPLRDYVAALPPGIPLSNEVRSLEIERRWPDPVERATRLAQTLRRILKEWEES